MERDIIFREAKYWKNFEQNDKAIALNILFVPYNTETIRVVSSNQVNQVILLMITDGNKWHYIAISNLSELLRRKSRNH